MCDAGISRSADLGAEGPLGKQRAACLSLVCASLNPASALDPGIGLAKTGPDVMRRGSRVWILEGSAEVKLEILKFGFWSQMSQYQARPLPAQSSNYLWTR